MRKTILITGASNGFGNDAAKALAAAGHHVFATMRDVNTRHRVPAEALRAKGIETLELDVTNNASVDAAFAALFQKTGGTLDVLVNNAGLFSQGVSETYTPEQVRDLFEVNVFGIQRVTRAALPAMRKTKSGLIVNVGSILGRVTIPFMGLYGASKHAVEALTDSYRYELSQLGVDVVLVQPSAYQTNLYAAIQKPADGGRAAGYGDVAALPGRFAEFLHGVFSSADAPDPQDVTKALVVLIATPAGQRPDRVLVGAPYGADAANAALKPIQGQLVSGIGFDVLSTLKVG
ncbi:SDR family oxidoreductase [Frigoriglobus tundricola]|uniref:Short-chain dehydrogenase/reductase SDR n=1 Tax=Frigoriglobus tundricola TaxID=2774151 RepID=A0A6M5YIW6_9BACT|nr:SDR family oxidoreductase [Frigoriglobus tundricola]QJW93945.1 Short-chain dehydrogenase/reductase SDR [Frigoriglobus tundricola]